MANGGVAIEPGRAGVRPNWTTQYPPLLMVAAVLFLLLVVLPSSLNLPQASTQTTPEYAPVPPSDDDPPPSEQGNLSSLALASSGDLGSGIGEGDGEGGGGLLDPAAPTGAGRKPSNKRCVGKPPRQTEDPQSPPCVAYFAGDNFGATYQGVDAEEIRIAFYFDPTTWPTSSNGGESDPRNVIIDLDREPQDDDPMMVRNLRPMLRYYNDRYQTYGRRVHGYVQYSSTAYNDKSPTARRADASTMFDRVKPFAVFNYTSGADDDYTDAIAKRGILNFGSYNQRERKVFSANAGRIWGYQPSVEQQAENFSSYVCAKVVNKPVTFSGNPGENGRPRKLGLLYSTQPDKRSYATFAKLVKERVAACGGEIALERTMPRSGYSTDFAPGTYAQENMAAFRNEGVTTIIWPQGYNPNHSKAAGQIGYRPEWVLAGDLLQEGLYNTAAWQDHSVWRHAFVVTTVPLSGSIKGTPCYAAQREADPALGDADVNLGCTFYPAYEDMRQLFTGIQVAGPRLGPTSVEKGFRAIPPYSSGSVTIPACYYEPGDYTCVKDATAMWWDPTATTSSVYNGCWRMVEGGRRYRTGEWTDENVDAQRTPGDPCTEYTRSAYVY